MCLAVPGRVEEIYERDGIPMGKVDFGGVTKEVCLAYLPDISVGEFTIVHVGFALSKVDEESARQTLDLIDEVSKFDSPTDNDPNASVERSDNIDVGMQVPRAGGGDDDGDTR